MGAADTYACALTDTSAHLPRKVARNIEAGKFVDIYEITREAVQSKEEGEKTVEKGRKKSIFDWLKGFFVFASVYLKKQPEQCLNVIKYMDTIVDTCLFYKGSSWFDYDRAFRKKMVSCKMLSFGQKDIDLWTRWVSKEGNAVGSVKVGSAFKQRNVCFAYNERRCSRGFACKFKHACLSCGASHVVGDCLKKGDNQGFRQPFRAATQKSGNANSDGKANNHPEALKQKIEKEVGLGRMAGPFSEKPIADLVVSPLGIVPKKETGKFRMIQHLSYPEGGSVNDALDKEQCRVQYQSFDEALEEVKKLGGGALLAKVDIESRIQAGRLDEQLPKQIPFTILSGDKGFLELESQFKKTQRPAHILNPHHLEGDMMCALLNSISDTMQGTLLVREFGLR
ncbi:hypothetical protein XELAEV_18027368mg [Xenopus laevis]|uniref:C3H1-type domain-containing protein n=1 Tax=Xenopus laevis TaxID=8355 RepID=A0A974CW82_XENLA|nr:hypothetical protein XELAEV_18027368mg [Xenopus laevis]